MKDTFMRLTGDQFWDLNQSDSEYWTASNVTVDGQVSNTVVAYNAEDTPLGQATVNGEIYRDFVLTKDYTVSGNSVTTGSIVTYTVTVKHEGTATYDALPLVDQLANGQVLLVPVSENSSNNSLSDVNTRTVNGTDYYVLDTAGTYKNVKINSSVTADKIIVDSDGSTLIYCYLVVNKDDTKNITYTTLVEQEGDADGFSLKNQVWLNDHETHRLYAETSLNGSVLSIEKQIVTVGGNTPEEDATVSYSILSGNGEQVIYRLELKNNSDNPLTVTGDKVYDALPVNVFGTLWDEGNISISVAYGTDATVTGSNWETGWSVTTVEPGSDSTEENLEATQCYIVWTGDHTLTFTGSVYIYVTLTYPSGDAWTSYYNAYQSTTLVNAFHAYALESEVSHTISSKTKATLYKGVYATGLTTDKTSSGTFTASDENSALLYYTSDSGSRYGCVQYYVVLYNEGPVNLYLNTLTDTLPSGFTYINDSVTIATDTTGITVSDSSGESVELITDCSVADTANKNATGSVSFNISGGSLGSDTTGYYLKPGQAVVFTYKVLTGTTTGDSETNTITMPFNDYVGGGLSVSEKVSADTVTGSWYNRESLRNDGGTNLVTDKDSDGNITYTLSSSVTVACGEIRPAITKSATSTSYGTADVITWNITVTNEGESTMTDYSITDVIESPYVFYSKNTTSYNKTGYTLYYTVTDETGTSYTYYICNFYNFGADEYQIYTFTKSSITPNSKKSAGYGTSISCYAYYYNMGSDYGRVSATVTVDKDDDGNYVLKVDFADARFALAAGTTGVLTVSTQNPTSTNTNGTIENAAYVTPTSQTFTDVGSVGIEVPEGEEDGEEVVDYQHSVESKAQVPVSYASGTTSSKGVTELDDNGDITGNSVTSSTTTSALGLTDDSSTFQYTLTVNNGTSPINSLTLWDSLPEVGDADVITGASRYSQFKVSLADVPGFTVTVTDGTTTYNLEAGTDYTIQYTSDTSSTADLTDDSVTWTEEPSDDTRAFHVIFKFGDGCKLTSIPANATVTVTFNAVIDGGADSGATAWNSFSYSYTTSSSGTPITATPLQVGVQAPYVPTLVKQVQNVDGSTITLTKDTEYTFLIYQGSELEDVDTSDVQALLEALNENNSTFTVVTLKVEAGKGADSMALEGLHAYTLTKGSDGTYTYSENTESEWTWENYVDYTVVELTQDETYPFFTWSNGSSTAYENSYTFQYKNNTNVTLTCVNQVESYELPSAGGAGTWMYILIGTVLCCGAAVVLLRRKESE
ncbi:MAG: DUF11 domain-containing protein [Bacteroidales bacterium]|nr:DUF11 domain-containing protein [Bacteroidales bacterium]